ncbi:folate-biopterin transporter 1, chloroplastic-like [Eucalyptus grandis]|uniref:folate-biopterin transporter 1, chloroplastic-like n=1 Tax=Eucalyptus grandis TaxID=71139 RepID=UPI00192E8C3C|nr:folate-biopterin transporter 1, chloroplastic-like [Eucalyptus grandis]
MSTAVQMPAAPRRWDEDHDRLLNSMGAGNGDTLTVNDDKETSTSSKNVLRKEKSYTSSISFFGVDLSPDNIAVAMVYFVQGVLGLSRLGCIFIRKMIDI